MFLPAERQDVNPFQQAAVSQRGTGKTQRGRTKKDGSTNIKKSSANHIQPTENTAIGSKDTSLFLFRALGKILYCKSKSLQISVTLCSVVDIY